MGHALLPALPKEGQRPILPEKNTRLARTDIYVVDNSSNIPKQYRLLSMLFTG